MKRLDFSRVNLGHRMLVAQDIEVLDRDGEWARVKQYDVEYMVKDWGDLMGKGQAIICKPDNWDGRTTCDLKDL